MQTVIDELVTILSVDIKAGTAPVVNHFSTMLEGVTRTAGFATAGLFATAGALMASGAAIFDFGLHQAHAASSMERFSRVTGTSLKEMQQWGYAAEKFGGNAEDIKNDILTLEKTSASILPGQFNMWLKRLGVDPFEMNGARKDPFKLYKEVIEELKQFSKPARMEIASGLGLSDSTLLFAMKEASEVKKAMSEAPVMSDADFASAREFENEWKTFLAKYQHVKMEIGVKMLPSLQKAMDFFYDISQGKAPGVVNRWTDAADKFFKEGWMGSDPFVSSKDFKGLKNSVFSLPKENGWTPETDAYWKGRQGPTTLEEAGATFSAGWEKFLNWMGESPYSSSKKGLVPPNPSATVPLSPGGQPVSKNTEINVTQHITGESAKEIADMSAESLTQTLQLLFPGGLSPITQ